MLKKPPSQVQPLTETPPEPLPPTPEPKTQKEETLEKAHLIFGSKLGGPLERQKRIAAASQLIAGVSVPPRPDEPDNCCMSGCVNCVWDLYRDEMEEWAGKSKLARRAMEAQRQEQERTRTATGTGTGDNVAMSMDDDGGGSETNWSEGSEESLFDDIPVGIREFMRTEKKLKMMQKEQRDKQAAAA